MGLHFPAKQGLTSGYSCDKVEPVNGDEGNKYPVSFCPEKSRLVQGTAGQQAKYLPELQAECRLGLVGCAAYERYKRRSVALLWGMHS